MSAVAESKIPLKPEVAEFCARAVAALRAKLPVREVWLFGSQAEGTANRHSDVDLFVVLPDDHGLKRPGLECYRAVSQLDKRPAVDVISLTQAYWHHPRYRSFGMWSDIAQKGICLFESGEFFSTPATDLPPMPGDPTVPESWFHKARRDLRSAKILLPNDEIENSLVLLEQAAEKLLKGWLIERGWNLERTHLLGDLLAEVEAQGVALDWFATDAEALSRAFLHMRYPSDTVVPSLGDVEEIITQIERLFSQLGVNL